MPTLLCDAVAFGFGPVGKLLAILSYLDPAIDVVFIGHGTSAELALGSIDRLVQADTERLDVLRQHEALFRSADLFLNVMNPRSAHFARSLGVPLVIVDSLFWMWDQIDRDLLSADRYFVQNFHSVAERIAADAGGTDRVELVGPIVDGRRLGRWVGPDSRALMVNFGGVQSPMVRQGPDLAYPMLIGRALEAALRDHQADRILFTGGREAMAELATCLDIPRAEYRCLSHEDLLSELAQVGLILTSPGLTMVYEALSSGVPMAFLPPQNYSQFFNLLHLRERGVAERSVHWNDLYADHNIVPRMPEADGVAAVLGLIRRVGETAEGRRELERRLAQTLAPDPGFVDRQCRAQAGFLNAQGPNGAVTIAGAIHEMLGLA